MPDGGVVNGKSILPDNWIVQATSKQADTAGPDYGYGYQWWTLNDGVFEALGIFGQGIFIDPKQKLIIASNSNWPQVTDDQGGDQDKKRLAFYRQVQLAVDAEVMS